MKLTNNKILITGGASGIGLGLTKRFLEEGNIVIICGRREELLNGVAKNNPGVITKVCDLTIPKERIGLFNWINENHSDLNVLINNAGIQQWMNITDADFLERAKDEITTNIEAPIHLVSLFLNLKKLNTIMNVTSALSFSPLTKAAVYSATKAFFHSYTLSIRHLLKSKNIEVIEIVPPAINTDLGGKGIHDYAPPVSDFISSIFEQLKQGKNQLTFGFSDTLAKANPDELQKAFERMNP